MRHPPGSLDRRNFLKAGAAAFVGAAAARAGGVAAAEPAAGPAPIAVRPFGKTGRTLPILGFGGAALPEEWMNPLSLEDRVKLVRTAYDRGIRFFDTAGNYLESQSILGQGLKGIRDKVFLVTKVETTDPAQVRGAVEKSLRELQTDRLDALLIHGTPGLQQMTVERAMEIHAELVKLRDEKVIRLVGFSAHGYFDKALALIETGGFDLCMLAWSYIPRGHDQIFSARMVALRDACMARAHARGMGIVAMKVVGAGVLGAWSGHIVPGFDKARLQRLPAAAIRYAMTDGRIHVLNIGMRLESEIDANVRALAGDLTYTDEDRALLAEFSAKAYESDALKKMKLE